VLLRTSPIDPQDPMRGDFVRFDYEIAHVPKSLCRDGTQRWFSPQNTGAWRARRDQRVFARIQLDDEGIASLIDVSDRRPSEGLFLRGRAMTTSGDRLEVRFGAEAMFTQQGKAREFERAAADRPGVPVDVEVAVGADGTAVLRRYRWEPLGITLELDRPPRPAAPAGQPRQAPGLAGLTVQLKNYSDRPVAIVVRPQGGSFRLVRNERWSESRYAWVGEASAMPKPEPEMVRTLPPGGTYREHLDFRDPAWFIRSVAAGEDAAPKSIANMTNFWGASFRIEYVPPTKVESAAWPKSESIRHTPLRSRAFTGGSVD
jgi:uncharacterized membrane-anchored protein